MAGVLIPDHLMNLWGGSEASFGAGPAALPVAANAIEHLSLDAPFPKRRVVPNAEATGHRGQRLAARGALDPMALKLLTHLRGSGTPTTPPPVDFLLKAAGFEENIGGAEVTYEPALNAATSAWLWGATPDGETGVCYTGVVVPDFGMPDVGTDNSRLEFSGQAARGAVVYRTQLGGALALAATALPLAPGHGWVVRGAPAFIRVTEGPLTEVMRVVALTDDTATVVRDVASTGEEAFTSAAIVTAWHGDHPAPAVAPVGEVGGGFSLDDGGGAVDREFVKAGLTIRTGVDLLEKPALGEYRTALAIMRRGEDAVELTGDVVYTVGDGGANGGISYLHGHANSGDPLEVVMVVGSDPGNRITVTLPLAQVHELTAPLTVDGPRKGTVIFRGFSLDGVDVRLRFD